MWVVAVCLDVRNGGLVAIRWLQLADIGVAREAELRK